LVLLAQAQDFEGVKRAAQQGNAKTQNNLGLMYADGQGVKPSDAEAVKWLRKAAKQGDANAQFNLGWMVSHGQGVTRNKAEAMKWYRKAAKQGNQLAEGEIEYPAAPCGSEDGICEIPFSLKVASLTIDKEGWQLLAPSFSIPQLNCADIPVSKAAVLSYFRRVRRVSVGTNNVQVSQSPCHLHGELRNAAGRTARWNIGIGSEGMLYWLDDKDEDGAIYLYCGRCRPNLLYPD
jgi:TPR repeat protein